MKKRTVTTFSALILTCCFLVLYANAWADVQWKNLKQLRFKEKPLDFDVSLDGQNLYILVEGKLIIYSMTEAKGKYSIPVNKSLDTLKISEANESVILLSTSENVIEIIQVQFIPQFDVSGLPFRGAEKAPVTICAFFDYQCQHCAQLKPLLQQVLDQYPDKVKVVFKNFPFEGEEMSLKAATAALAANEQNRFWEFHEMLFANADQLNDLKIQTLAAELGLNIKKFNLDLKSPSIQGLINRDIGEATQLGVTTIPAVFINGKRLEDLTLQGFQEMIDAELNKKTGLISDQDK